MTTMTNREGLTFSEWMAAARMEWVSDRPALYPVELAKHQADWLAGVDPSDVRLAFEMQCRLADEVLNECLWEERMVDSFVRFMHPDRFACK
jgi:hypothetical protein